MKKVRFIEEQMVMILRGADKSPVAEVANRTRMMEFARTTAGATPATRIVTRKLRRFIVSAKDQASDAITAT